MDGLKIQHKRDESGLLSGIKISGNLVVENARQLKKEFLDVAVISGKQLNVEFVDVDDIDVSCIQLIVAFASQLEKQRVKYRFDWDISIDLKELIENVGLSEELFINIYE